MIKTRILIVGSGFSGLALAHYFKAAGLDDFTILEKAAGLGGTWRENTYPGAECDVPSALYSFSFAPNPTWDFKWARQAQILTYLQKTADDFGLAPHITFNREVISAHWDAATKRWTVTCKTGEIYSAQFFISAVGQLHHPSTPAFPGRDDFTASHFHSACWDHTTDLTDKRVAVIGSAASALQLIPEVAEIAGRLDIYQRSPNHVLPKIDAPATRFEKSFAKAVPWWSKVRRAWIWCMGEYGLWPAIKGAKLQSKAIGVLAAWNLRRSVKDKAMRATLTPDYPLGAKRILFSDTYYPALMRENVTLITAGISKILPNGIEDGHGKSRDYDAIIYATGFHTNPFLKSLDVRGTGGKLLRGHWREGAQAYLGMTTSGFPNMAMMYGPNTNIGHTSMVYFIECQARYLALWVKAAGADGALDVKPEIEAQFNTQMQTRLKKLAWNKIEASWYKDGDKITNNWCGGSREYRRVTARLNPDDYTAL